MSTSISAPAGFFQADTVGPDTATDLVSAVNAAAANVTALGNAVTASAASATAAAASASMAAASATTATTQATSATSQATTATGAASAASSSASAASTSATAANGSATTAASSATTAGTSATSAGTSATNAANSATAAASSATSASTSATAAITAGYGNVGRNFIHNPRINFFARGAGAFTTNGAYTADRWLLLLNTDAASVTVATLADADRAALGDESAVYALQNAFTGNAAAGAFNAVSQRIEGVRRLSNTTVTVSFWAKAVSGTPKLGVSVDQGMGTGGSPSSNVTGAGQAVTLSTTWTQFQKTFTLASLSGLTLGTAGNDYTQLNFWFSSGATNATRAGSVGVQASTISVRGVQLEIGSAATALENLDTTTAYAQCQRFYQIGGCSTGVYGPTATGMPVVHAFPVLMRAVPSVTQALSGTTNCTTASPSATASAIEIVATVTATGAAFFAYNFTASADL